MRPPTTVPPPRLTPPHPHHAPTPPRAATKPGKASSLAAQGTPVKAASPLKRGASPSTSSGGGVLDVTLDAPARQEFLAAAVGYAFDDGPLSDAERAVLAHIAEAYDVPADFETDKTRFGPLSGATPASRLLANFASGTLPLKAGRARVEMCAACGEEGHWRADCPSALG